MKITFCTMLSLALACCIAPANAAIILNQSQNADPAPGLQSFTISATGTEGELVNAFAGINIASGVHNVQGGGGVARVHSGDWVDSTLVDAAWRTYDTYVLIDLGDSAQVVGALGNALVESTDGSDPAGLGLAKVLAANSGIGAFGGQVNADQFTLTPAASGTTVAFLQVVQPAGSTTLLDVRVLGGGTDAQFEDYAITAVPEPTTVALACLGMIGIVTTRRRNK